MRRVNQAEHAVLDEIPEINRVRHRGCHPASQRLDKRKNRGHPILPVFSANGARSIDHHPSSEFPRVPGIGLKGNSSASPLERPARD